MYLAWQEIKRNKSRFTMIGVIIILMTWLIFLLTGLGNGLSSLNAAAIQNINGQYLVFEFDSDNKFSKSIISADIIPTIESGKGIDAVTPMGSSIGAVVNVTKEDDKKTDITLQGIIPNSFIEPKVIEGNSLSKGTPNEVLADASLKNTGYQLGDKIKFSGFDTEYNIRGFVENNTFNHLPSIIMDIKEWQLIRFSFPGSDDGIEHPVNAFVLQTNEDFNHVVIEDKFSNIQVATRQEAVQAMPGYKEENGTIMLMLAFLIVISIIIIAVFFYVITMQKSQQFGVMKAIGASNSFISKMILSQVAIITFFSIILGIFFTYLVAAILPKSMPFTLETSIIFMYALLIFITSLISTLFSVRQIVKIDPLLAIGRVE